MTDNTNTVDTDKMIADMEALKAHHADLAEYPRNTLVAHQWVIIINDVYAVGSRWDEESGKRFAELVRCKTPPTWERAAAEKLVAWATENIKKGDNTPADVSLERVWDYHARRVASLEETITMLKTARDIRDGAKDLDREEDAREAALCAANPHC